VTITLSDASLSTAGVLLLSLLAVEWGGTFLLKVVQGDVPATDFQKSFFRAGHAHAGVLVTLGLVCTVLVDATALEGVWQGIARSGVAAAAILMSAGFFLSAGGRGRERPNRMIVLLWLGAASLAAGAATLGVGLLTA
jgi:hypothetical protein